MLNSLARTPKAVSTQPQLRSAIEPGGQDEPPIGADIYRGNVRWELILTLYLRFLAVIFMIKGLSYWGQVIGLGQVLLSEETPLRQGLIVGFALLDCAAAVGLWLLNAWGKSLFLFLCTVEMVFVLTLKSGLITIGSAVTAGMIMAVFFAILHAENISRR
jgi:hypothetical protein